MISAGRTGEIEVAGAVTQVEAGDMMYAEANILHGIRNTGHPYDVLLYEDPRKEHLASSVTTTA